MPIRMQLFWQRAGQRAVGFTCTPATSTSTAECEQLEEPSNSTRATSLQLVQHTLLYLVTARAHAPDHCASSGLATSTTVLQHHLSAKLVHGTNVALM
jgi:hypothetical protein